MKIRNITCVTLLATSALLAQSGEALFGKYCTSCHTTVVGVNESGGKETPIYEAPYAGNVISTIKEETKTKEAFMAFIKDYINEPDKRKSLYGKKAIKDFGLMPSLKGAMSDSESTILAEYMYSDYGKEPQKVEEDKVVLSEAEKRSAQELKANEALFSKYCASCHTTVVGVDESGGKITHIYEAPYAKDVVNKLKAETKTKEAFITFVQDYINKPNKRKSLYGKKAIKDFGLMPSLKGAMTESESRGLVEYLYGKEW
ncbi:MAG: cytochrome c [Campylobacterota bacterium]|nr:cytochrome c [Campylobacterota bacterium]